MTEHFIRNIEIKNFKLFKDFKAKGFGRVNLIGGKNNVGKTAFMEACYLSQAKDTLALYKKLLEIDTHRNIINNLLENTNRETKLQELIMKNIGLSIYIKNTTLLPIYETSNKGEKIHVDNDELPCGLVEIKKNDTQGTIDIYTKFSLCDFYQDWNHSPHAYTYSKLIDILNVNFIKTNYQFSINFISPYSNSSEELENIIGQSKLDEKYDILNQYLFDVFDVTAIDAIKNKPMLKSNGEYKELSHFGQGIKTFINIVSSILLLKDDFIFIDEIENGIHYTNLDKLWEIILTISKEQNVQVFATTHSKECIESFNRVQKELQSKDSYYFEIYKNVRKDTISMRKIDDEQLEYELKQGKGFRGE